MGEMGVYRILDRGSFFFRKMLFFSNSRRFLFFKVSLVLRLELEGRGRLSC